MITKKFFIFGLILTFFVISFSQSAEAAGVTTIFDGFTSSGAGCNRSDQTGCQAVVAANTQITASGKTVGTPFGDLSPGGSTAGYQMWFGATPWGNGSSSVSGTISGLPTSDFSVSLVCDGFAYSVSVSGNSFSSPTIPGGSVCNMSIDLRERGGGGGGACGDNVCRVTNGESCNTCSQDCGSCGSQVSVSISPSEQHVTEGGNQYKVYQVTVNSWWGHTYNLSAACNAPGMSCHFYKNGSPVTECSFGQSTYCGGNTFFDQESHTGDTAINGSATFDLYVRNYYGGTNLAADTVGYPFSVAAQLTPYYDNGNSSGNTIYCTGQCGGSAAAKLFVDPPPCTNFIIGGPSRLSCSNVTQNSFQLNWTPGVWTGASNYGSPAYTVTRTSTNSGNLANCPSGTICNNNLTFGTNSVTISGLQPNTTYYNRVAQICNNASGSFGGYKDEPDLSGWGGNTANNWSCTTLSAAGPTCTPTSFNDTKSGLTAGHIASIGGISGANSLNVSPNSQFTVSCDFGVAPTNDIALPYPTCVWNGSLVSGTTYWYHCTAPSTPQTVNISCNIVDDNQPGNFCSASGPTPAMTLNVTSGLCIPNSTQACSGSNAACGGIQTCNSGGSAWSSCVYTSSNGNSCSTGNACTVGQSCSNGSCTGGSTNTCTPSECQTASSCNGSGGCSTTNKPAGTPCSVGQCNSSGQCVSLLCPSASVQLSSNSVGTGSNVTASAPSGWSGGSFSSNAPAVASVSGSTVSGNSVGTATISGNNNWTASNGASNCALSGTNLTVASGCTDRSSRPGGDITAPSSVSLSTPFQATCGFGSNQDNVQITSSLGSSYNCSFSSWSGPSGPAIFTCPGIPSAQTVTYTCSTQNVSGFTNWCSPLPSSVQASVTAAASGPTCSGQSGAVTLGSGVSNVTNVRVSVSAALQNYSRIVELEAWGNGVNYARSSNGGSVSASSECTSATGCPYGEYPVSSVINGDRRAVGWGTGAGGWNDNTRDVWSPNDVVTVTFSQPRTLNEIDVYTLGDTIPASSDPTPATTFTQYGITAFTVQYSTNNGGSWTTVPNGSVSGNNLVLRKFNLASGASSASMLAGETIQAFSPTNWTNVTFESSDSSVASVSNTTVSALSGPGGTANITGTGTAPNGAVGCALNGASVSVSGSCTVPGSRPAPTMTAPASVTAGTPFTIQCGYGSNQDYLPPITASIGASYNCSFASWDSASGPATFNCPAVPNSFSSVTYTCQTQNQSGFTNWCSLPAQQQRTVSVSSCSPVNGGWSVWGTCVAGTQTRTCNSPTPSCGGANCSGSSSQSCVGTQSPVTVTSSSCGTVTSSPSGISCGANCNTSYDYGTPVTLTATATPQCTFVGWSGNCSGTNPVCNLTVDGAKNVTPIFGLKPFFYQEF